MRVQRRSCDLLGQPRILLGQSLLDLVEDALFVGREWHRLLPLAFHHRTRSLPRGLLTAYRPSLIRHTHEQGRRLRGAHAEPALDPVDRSLDVAPPLPTKEGQLLLPGRDQPRGL